MCRLGVLGWPVGHSRSPAMHNAALRACGLTRWRYQLLPVPPALLEETLRALPGAGFCGLNVTIPHKEAALALAADVTERAAAIGAANTLWLGEQGGQAGWQADNTDAAALIDALPVAPRGRTALVLGAGGSARAAVWALREAGAAEVRVWNRTPWRAQRLAEELGAVATEEVAPADILVHCTSVGLDRREPVFSHLPISADDLQGYACVADFVYRTPETELIAATRARGVPHVDGLELLVGQGALSFAIFTGHAAPVGVMRAAVAGR